MIRDLIRRGSPLRVALFGVNLGISVSATLGGHFYALLWAALWGYIVMVEVRHYDLVWRKGTH